MDDESRKSIQEAARQFASLQGEPEEPNDIVSGVVTDVAADGYVWVSVAGSTAPVPCVPEVACIKGDKVSVLMDRGAGRCYVVGNQSSPSPSGAALADVDAVAQRAQQDASAAQDAAATAQGAAEDAQDAAEAAQGIANAAQYSLAEVENVVGTLNWIAEHGTYSLTQDSAIVSGKPYYTRSGTSPDYIYTVVAEPVASELSTYYELHLDESVQNFLASHIWLDQYGLNIAVSNTNAYRIHQGTVDGTKTVGMYVIDAGGNIVADFTANGAQIGKSNSTHVNIDSDSLDLIDGSSNVLATFGANSATIGKTSGKRAVFNQNGMSIYDGSKFCMSVGGASSGTTTVAGLYLGREVPAIETVGTGYFHLYNEGADFVMDTDGTFKFGLNSSITTASISASSGAITLGTNKTAEENGIRVKGGGTRNAWLLRNISAANGDGDAVLLGNGGVTIIGGGEAHNSLWNALGVSAGSERLDLASDGNVNIWSNCNTIANRGQAYFTTNNSGSYAQTLCIDNGLASPLAVAKNANNGWTDTDSNGTYSSVQLRDKNGYWTGVWGSYVVGSTTAAVHGANCTYIGARNKTTPTTQNPDGTDVANYINLYVRKDGTRTVSVSDAGAWRTALGIGTNGAFPVTKAQGGTGKTNTDTTYYGAKSLYAPSSPGTGNVTLSETAANFSMMLIQYRDNDSNYSSKLIIGPNGKRVVLDMVYGVSGVGNLKSRTVTISGTSITTVSGSTMDAAHNGGAGTTNHIYITQVWGWK